MTKQASELHDTLKLEFFDIKEGNILKKRNRSIEIDRDGHEIAYIANNLKEEGKIDAFILVLTSTKRRPMTELVKFELDGQDDWFMSKREVVWGKMYREMANTENWIRLKENRALECWVKNDKVLLVMSR